jgi:hypothetical protein
MPTIVMWSPKARRHFDDLRVRMKPATRVEDVETLEAGS